MPAINGIPVGLIAMSSLSSYSPCSAGVVLERPTFELSILIPFLKRSIPPIIWNASKVISKKFKVTDPSKENKINVMNVVRDPFLAISIFSSLGNLFVMIISIGKIPIGFIRVNKVVRQKIKNLSRAAQICTFYILSGELIPRMLKPFFKMTFTALINFILAIVRSSSLVITLQWL